ncbi:hypothetical protein, partial [Longispora fulva]|uniref:hypothetical protein n=1 Tax=Longispora fulva TaxID=619741 RepID=UPI00363408D0
CTASRPCGDATSSRHPGIPQLAVEARFPPSRERTLMTARPVRLVVGAAFMAVFAVLVATTADLLHLLHASLLLALGVGAMLGRPRTG